MSGNCERCNGEPIAGKRWCHACTRTMNRDANKAASRKEFLERIERSAG